MKRIMEEAQSKGSSELPPWLVENRDFSKFLKEAEKVCVLLLTSNLSGLCNKYDHKVISFIFFFSMQASVQSKGSLVADSVPVQAPPAQSSPRGSKQEEMKKFK